MSKLRVEYYLLPSLQYILMIYYKRKKNSGVGCCVGIKFVRAVSYADNIILLAPTVKVLTILITVCELYAAEFDIQFNGAKSKYMVFKGRNCDVFNIDIHVNGVNAVPSIWIFLLFLFRTL